MITQTLYKYSNTVASGSYKQGAKKIAYASVKTEDQTGFTWEHNRIYGRSLRSVRVKIKEVMKKLPAEKLVTESD